MVVSPANAATSNGDPQFAVDGVPPVSNNGLPPITQPSVYFGLNNRATWWPTPSSPRSTTS